MSGVFNKLAKAFFAAAEISLIAALVFLTAASFAEGNKCVFMGLVLFGGSVFSFFLAALMFGLADSRRSS